MTAIKGIAGVFINNNDPARLVEWYESVLGLAMERHPTEGHYHVFWHRDPESGVLRENPVFAINGTDAPLADEPRQFVLGLRVDDLDAFLENLRGHTVPIDPNILVWARGKHARINDPDRNVIELYEELLAGEQSNQD